MIKISTIPNEIKSLNDNKNLYRFSVIDDRYNMFDYFVDMKIVQYGMFSDNKENIIIVDDLQQKINKAIEYIERNCLEFNVKYACQGLNNDKVDVLLDILRGKNEKTTL